MNFDNDAFGLLLELTDALFDNCATISCIKAAQQVFNKSTKTIKTALMDHLTNSDRDTAAEELINLATVLDPRFPTNWLLSGARMRSTLTKDPQRGT